MSFATGLILGSMMSGRKDSLHTSNIDTSNTYRDLTLGESLFFSCFTVIVSIIMIYVICIRDERKMLKDAINNLVYYNVLYYLHPQWHSTHRQLGEFRQRQDRIQRRIEALQKEPVCFGSPLYIARLQLRTEINSKLDELKIELENLENKIKKL